MKDHEGAVRGFVHTGAAWYASTALAPGILDEIMVGMYHPEGGTSGEFSVEWKMMTDKPTPCLKVFNDAWHALSQFKDLLAKMAEEDDKDITPDQFCELLLSCGIDDQTPTSPPENRLQHPARS